MLKSESNVVVPFTPKNGNFGFQQESMNRLFIDLGVYIYMYGEIQFYNTLSILTLLKTSQNRGKPCMKRHMYEKTNMIKHPIYLKPHCRKQHTQQNL